MATEIELKLLVEPDTLPALDKMLLSLDTDSKSTLNLLNTYFDTKDLILTKLKIALRVRENAGLYEQTIKTKMPEEYDNGLHVHPEYNVKIDTNTPDLSKFKDLPTDLFEQIKDLIVVPIFTTNFTRHTWVVNVNNSKIEVAFDLGDITYKHLIAPISEIELELKSGIVEDIYMLEKLINSKIKTNPGLKSKAARGYELYHQI